MRHFDLHADTLSKCLKGRKSLVHNDYAISVERGLIFDQWVQAFAVFVPDELHGSRGYHHFLSEAEVLSRAFEESDKIVPYDPEHVKSGVCNAMLTVEGGSAIGGKLDGSPWQVAVKDPQNTSEALCVLSLSDQTASTSGGYERYFEQNGVIYHHIIDPKTGYPAQSGLLSVTVVSSNQMLADALSTALFVGGEEDALAFWRSRDDFELVLCTEDNRVIVTEGLEAGYRPAGEERGYTYEIARR